LESSELESSELESSELESSDTVTENNSNDDQLTEGVCGENLVWTLNQEGVLSIDGSGKMTDINVKNGESSIWTSYTDEINAIVIGANVESIGAHAFEGLRKVTTVTFAEGSKLTSIGSYAFADCSLLEEFIIPEGAKCIGAAAFKNCNSLKVISVPDSVENFDLLSEVDIEDENVTESMIESSFEGCISEEFHILTNAGSLAEAYANTKGIKCKYN
ncbi:leucine-rich repeat domain-containing protein, partial [Faecalicatena contorta]|uniref:leucine-rich repeat domain-containing protein n=1 Tax=Faecalicatena contorta TaxID=39482 RepID=UPI001F277919